MLPVDFDPIADYMAEDPYERLGVLTFGISSWMVAVVTDPPMGLLQSVIQIIPPLVGIYVAHRSMERAHALRMEKLWQEREKPVADEVKPDPDTVDLP
jgi:uncharacterized membrane protein